MYNTFCIIILLTHCLTNTNMFAYYNHALFVLIVDQFCTRYMIIPITVVHLTGILFNTLTTIIKWLVRFISSSSITEFAILSI